MSHPRRLYDDEEEEGEKKDEEEEINLLLLLQVLASSLGRVWWIALVAFKLEISLKHFSLHFALFKVSKNSALFSYDHEAFCNPCIQKLELYDLLLYQLSSPVCSIEILRLISCDVLQKF